MKDYILSIFFMKKNSRHAFTLIEILVVIAIISIIMLWASKINFNAISDKQRLNRIMILTMSNIETIRNNSLLWKWVSSTAWVPESYKINFWNTWSWNITTSYHTWWVDSVYDFSNKVNFSDKHISLTTIDCLTLSKPPVVTSITNWTWTIQFTWWKMEIINWCASNEKILEITIKRKTFQWTIQINTLSGLISIKN